MNNVSVTPQEVTMPTPADLRAERARVRLPLYRLAALVHVHPGRLGSMLNERITMPPDVVGRVAEAIEAAGR